MIQTGFDQRVKIQQIIDSQLPEFILDESPKTSEFLKQYYISQEYQGGSVDLVENLDQYLNLDNLTSEVISGEITLENDITATSNTIVVSSTKGFPSKYGILQIDDEIITYTGISANTFTGCIRGFCGVTNYHQDLNYEELVFDQSAATSHDANSTIKNLSSLFLQEFYKKIKFSLSPGLEGVEFTENLNVGNFLKEARTLYSAKGTPESFRILFNVLFGETPTVIDLEKFLIKPSDSRYIRRNVAVVDVLSGDITKLSGQTIKKSTDPSTTAAVSEIESIKRREKVYYKLNFFIGYDDTYPNVTGTFSITPSTKIIENVSVPSVENGTSVITVDSTIGFSDSGKIFYAHPDYDNLVEIFYSEKSINQFFGCYVNLDSSITIPKTSTLVSDETYEGYEDGDETKKVIFKITGVLSDLELNDDNYEFVAGDQIYPQNLGNNIKEGSELEEIFANTWVYNTSSRYQVDFFSGNKIVTKSRVNSSSLKVGDTIEILQRNTEELISGFENITVTNINDKEVEVDVNVNALNISTKYDFRRNLKTASSIVPIEFGDNVITSDIQNLYTEFPNYIYVASNSLPSYKIETNLFDYTVSSLEEKDSETEKYTVINFDEVVSFITGDKVFYYTEEETKISGLEIGPYYVEVLASDNLDINKKRVKLYSSRSMIGSSDYVSFGLFSNGLVSGTHKFVLYSQKSKTISPQKSLKKFKVTQFLGDDTEYETIPGPIGMLKNGVEIYNYKSNDKLYYGPIKNINVLNGGSEYDVINPPLLSLSYGSALIEPVVIGSVEKIYVDPQDFDIDVIVSIALTGGNGSGASFEPVIERYAREIEFDARRLSNGGGLDIENEKISFKTAHNLIDGQSIIYNSNNNDEIGIGTFKGSDIDQSKTLVNGATYYSKIINDTSIEIYQSYSDYVSGINTVGFTTIANAGIHKFKTEVKNKLTGIKVITGGSGYAHRNLTVSPSGISTHDHAIKFENHGFLDGELVTYNYETSAVSGLSTNIQYRILKVDSDTFRLCNAGVGGTSSLDYDRQKYVKLGTNGSGYQYFSYPEIVLSVDYSSIGLGSTQIKGVINATPIIRGKISQVYVYEKGNDYGSTVLNVHRRPQIIIKNGKESKFKPRIENGIIVDVQVLSRGIEYYSTPELIVKGGGSGAVLRPIIVNNKISDVIIVNGGIGYSEDDTSIIAVSSGKGAVLQSNIRDLTLNNAHKYGIQNTFFRDIANEILVESKYNLQYAVLGYSQSIKNNINDVGNNTTHSDIIGWAYDGNPIYGSFGYSDPTNSNSSIKRLQPGYTISSVENRPSTSEFPIGYFIEDYEYTGGGDLDAYNGRFGKTKDFPKGIYAYFATTEDDINLVSIGKFPYFVGNHYRSEYLTENFDLDQSFDFNNSKLLRNTSPYKVNDLYADNDFIVESNEIIEQKTLIESVSTGSINGFEILKSGSDYAVNDTLVFDDTSSGGGGVSAQVSEIKGKDIVNVSTTVESFNNSVITWENENSIRVYVTPYHEFSNRNNINISALPNQNLNLNDSYQIGVTTYSAILNADLENYGTTGKVTDIQLSSVPSNISVGSSIKIENEIFSVLNVYENFNTIRVSRPTSGVAHTQSTPVYFLPNSFVINKKSNYFDSKVNNIVYYNPTKSVGIGTTIGSGINVTYTIGITTYNAFVPTQSIFLPNHPFITGQEVVFRRLDSTNPIAVSNTPSSPAFNILSTTSETLYVINKSKDYIGIVTNVGLTTTNGLFLRSNGTDDNEYSIESNFSQLKVNVNKIQSVVSVSTSHNLKVKDSVNLKVKPNLSVGIGTSSVVSVKFDNLNKKIVIDPKKFTSSGINTTNNSITIASHKFKTGDKVVYRTLNGTIPTGLSTESYFVYRIDDNMIKLCETYNDLINPVPNFVDIVSSGIGTYELSLINPQIKSVKNNNLVFDLSDSSLDGYNLKIYYDKDFRKEFVSIGNTSEFSINGIGTAGITTTASLTINYSNSLPEKLYYNLEKSGYISTSDTDVLNYSEIVFENSLYNGSYDIVSVGTTTFTVFLKEVPEKLSYTDDDCFSLEYSTNSLTEVGGINKIKLLNGGYGYKTFPLFDKVESEIGSGALIVPLSGTIGRIRQSRIINEGFEYSSDKTIRPTASIPQLLYLSASNTIDTINILDGGENYTTVPDLILVNPDTGELIDSGLLRPIISGSSIVEVKIESEPKGLPIKPALIKAINNSNGVSIDRVQSSSSGIVTCFLTTPLAGFGSAPFAVGDRIFVEGIEKYDDSKDGFNSSDYGYQFFTIKNYYSLNPDKLEFDISGLSTNPGIAKTVQESYASIINYKNYPKFESLQRFLPFFVGEKLASDDGNGFTTRDLIVTDCQKNLIRVSGSYILTKNEKIRGLESFSEARIENIQSTSGEYNVSYFNLQNLDWQTDTGKLSESFQVLPDNDYYQSLSYSVKSTKTWEEIVSPVNSIVHISGTKNFSDTQLLQNAETGIGTTVGSVTSLINMFIRENRVDTINNFDVGIDVDTIGNRSKFIKFKNIRLTDYILCKTNRTLEIDDISSQFSSENDERTNVANILELNSGNGYNKFLVQVRNIENNETQFSEIITINNDSDIFTLSSAEIVNDNVIVSDRLGIIETSGISSIGISTENIETGLMVVGDYVPENSIVVSIGSSFISIDNQFTNVGIATTAFTFKKLRDKLATIRGYVDEDSKFYLNFEPEDPYNSNFDIKILQDTFISKLGIGSTQSVGFVDLLSQNKIVSSGSTESVFDLNISNYSAVHSNIQLSNSDGSKMNYVEIYTSHDGTDAYISEYYFDNNDLESYNFIGSFGVSLNGGILSLKYNNTSSEEITLRSKNVGFGTTAVGEDFYRFKLPGQINGNERTVSFESTFSNISSGSTSIFVLDKELFTSAKSTIKVGFGQTSSLHQILTIYDGSDVYFTQYPFLSIGSTTGIGTFGAEVSSTDFILKFYPDASIGTNVEILSLNEYFYTELDEINTPPDLVYTPVRQSVKTASYYGINSQFVNKLDFEAKYQTQPIFVKTFDPSDSSIVSAGGTFKITNHFFSTGEELIYTPKSTFIGISSVAMGIGATENYVGVVTTILPSIVYAIKENNDTFRIATKKEYAELGIGVTFTSFGSGNAHEFEMVKKNEKSLITINNLAQYPITYSYVNHTLDGNGGQIGASSTVFALSGISSISPLDLLKIDDEYVKVENVGLGTTSVGPITFSGNVPLVEVTRGFVGSISGIHTDTTNVRVYRGSYNISGNKIYFTQPPRGNQLDLIGPPPNNLLRERATFTGRVFLRNDYTSNVVYDDISDQFTGVGHTFTLTAQGINTVGLGTSGGNGIVFINNIFQSPTTLNNSSNNYYIEEDLNVGITSITFTGITTSIENEIFISESDVNMNQLPRGGIIVSLGSTPGLGYAPLVGASVTAVVGAGGTIISVGLGTQDILGSGYRNPVSVAITESGHTGSAATITASVGPGGVLSFNVVGYGTGYVNPTINVSSPSYENLSIVGVSRLGIGATTDTGVGLLLNVEVGASSTSVGIGSTLFEVKSFNITRNGYGFRRGDVFKPVGLVTDVNLNSPINDFEITVLDTFSDSFASWQFGELDYIDSVKNYQDGQRVRFPLYYNSELLSFEIDKNDSDSQVIDLNSVLVIFINGILQKPGFAYQFDGGTSLVFTTPPKTDDDIAIFFYRGTREEDSLQIDSSETIKVGDILQLFSNNTNLNQTITQDSRIVYDISGSDKVETNLYTAQGVDTINEKPIYWTKQKVDLSINGEVVSKSRDSLESQIYPTANIIQDFSSTSTELFVDNGELFNYEDQSPIQFDVNVFTNVSVGIATTNFSTQYELLSDVSNVEGFSASIVGIETTVGIGVSLGIKFTLSRNPFTFPDIQVGYPVYIFNTKVGSGVTSIGSNDNDIVGTSTSHLNNIYKVSAFNSTLGIMTCNVHSETSYVGIATTGTIKYPVGNMSWGRLSGFSRSSSPISIGVSQYTSSIGISSETYGAGLSTYPIVQRRGYGLRNVGPLVKKLP